MHKIILENTSIELELQSNDLVTDSNRGLESSVESQWCVLQEATIYDYRIQYLDRENKGENLRLAIKEGVKGIINANGIHPNSGSIDTKTFVGILFFEIYQGTEQVPIDSFYLKVRSVKVNYEDEYQYMLEEITATCADLLLRASSPVNQFFGS